MKKFLSAVLLTTSLINNLPLLTNTLLLTSSTEKDDKLSFSIKNYFEQTVIPVYNFSNGEAQIRIIIMKIIKQLNPENYKLFKIINLKLEKSSNKIILKLEIMKSSEQILNEQYEVNLQNLINLDNVIKGEIVYTEQIPNDEIGRIHLIIISKIDKFYQLHFITINDDYSNSYPNNDISIISSDQFEVKSKLNITTNFKPIFLVDGTTKKLRLNGMINNNEILFYKFSITDKAIIQIGEINHFISKSFVINDSSQFYRIDNGNMLEDTLVITGSSKNNLNEGIIMNFGYYYNEWKIIENGYSRSDIISNLQLLMSNDYILLLGTNNDEQWIAYKINYKNASDVTKMILPILDDTFISKMINWDEQSNTLSYLVKTNVGEKLVISDLNTNKKLFKSSTIKNYLMRYNNVDENLAQFDYNFEISSLLPSNKQILTRQNKLLNIANTVSNLSINSMKNFALIKSKN